MTHPPSGPSTPPPPSGPRFPPSTGRGALIALDSAIAAVIATATRSLPEPSTLDEEMGLAELMLRLQQARSVIAEQLHPKSPARRDPISAAVGSASDAIATTGGPVQLIPFPRAATPRAWGRTSW
jgi:hypothetical protein